MIKPKLSELLQGEEKDDPLSEDSEREILEMVEEQLDRPNPPDTKVLYRRAMYFIDRDVRHLSLQQFNAKFPLRVKRRRARERAGAPSSRSSRGVPTGATGGAEASPPRRRDGEPEEESEGAPRESPVAGGEDTPSEERRERLRAALLDFAKVVAGAGSRAELIDAVRRVDGYVDRVVED